MGVCIAVGPSDGGRAGYPQSDSWGGRGALVAGANAQWYRPVTGNRVQSGPKRDSGGFGYQCVLPQLQDLAKGAHVAKEVSCQGLGCPLALRQLQRLGMAAAVGPRLSLGWWLPLANADTFVATPCTCEMYRGCTAAVMAFGFFSVKATGVVCRSGPWELHSLVLWG